MIITIVLMIFYNMFIMLLIMNVIPWLFFPFDFTTMQPGAGTQRKLLLWQ